MSNQVKSVGNSQPAFGGNTQNANIQTNTQVPGVEGLNSGAHGGLNPHVGVTLPSGGGNAVEGTVPAPVFNTNNK
jgi:hypothetical protein